MSRLDPGVKPPTSNGDNYVLTNVSDFDSLSDSDWLDIASSRESDNGSVCSRDNDPDGTDSRPPSRISSISIGSSEDDEVQAWEGFADEQVVDGVLEVEGIAADSPLSLSPLSPSFAPVPDLIQVEDKSKEDQRVKDALDQSLIGTLSSSRSSAPAVHTSTPHIPTRDLRLSFPDPLSNSGNELQRSYEQICSFETSPSASESEESPVIDAFPQVEKPKEQIEVSDSVASESSGLTDEVAPTKLDIVLYGASQTGKWSFVDKLIEKAAIGGGCSLEKAPQSGLIRSMQLRGRNRAAAALYQTLVVTDATEEYFDETKEAIAASSLDHPSLAVVFLPCSPPSLFEHTLYLPVFVPGDEAESLDSTSGDEEAAWEMWELMGIPSNRTIQLASARDGLFDARDVEKLDIQHAYGVFEQLHSKARPAKTQEQHNSVNTMAIFAIVSLVLGLTVNAAFYSPKPVPTPTMTQQPAMSSMASLWSYVGPAVNASHVVPSPTVTNTNVAVIPSPLKALALSVFNPFPAVAPASPQPAQRSCKGPAADSSCDCGASEESGPKEPTEVMVRFTPSDVALHASTSATPSAADQQLSPSTIATETVTSLSLRTTGSLALVAKTPTKARTKAADDVKHQAEAEEVPSSMQGLIMNAVDRQAAAFKACSHKVLEGLLYRNEKARGKAKQIMEKGEQVVAFAEVMIRERSALAKKKAHRLKENVAKDLMWVNQMKGEVARFEKRARKARKKPNICRRVASKLIFGGV